MRKRENYVRGKKYRYNDPKERFKKMNSFFFLASLAVFAIILIFVWLKLSAGNMNRNRTVGNSILIAISVMVNVFLWKKDAAGSYLKTAISIEMGLLVLAMAMQSDAQFIGIALIGMMAVQVPYYELRSYTVVTLAYVAIYIVQLFVQGTKGIINNDIDQLCTFLITFGLFYVIWRIASISKQFSDDTLGTVAQQSRHQQGMIEHMVEISGTVREESGKSTEMVNGLVESTEAVAQSMGEISDATNLTAENIMEQNSMTQNIQQAIEETMEHSRQMVGIAKDSNEGIQENIRIMDELKEYAEQTKDSTEDITKIINELVENANAVVQSVEQSVGATGNQNEKIMSAADTFQKLEQNMTELISDIDKIDVRIQGLSESNNKIVESISQLSATTEQVTASAQEASNLSEHNLELAEQTKDAIALMRTTTESMEQYML